MARFTLLAVLCAAVALSSAVPQLYRFGGDAGDTLVSPNDDGSSPPISLRVPFPFFDEEHSTVYVNNNGDISFDTPVSQYTPDPFPLFGDLELIAPFWGDVDTRGTGQVWYRETTDANLTQRAGNEIQMAFINIANFRPDFLFIATWDRVGYYNRQTNLTNTFQCVMATDGRRSFVLFLYESITWITGDASGGSGGFGGTPAQVGFNAGDGIRYASVPGSRTAAIANIEETSNVGVPGLWIYRVDEEAIATGGCSEDPTIRPIMAPRIGNVLGGTAVQVAGPCLDPTDTVICIFDGIEVEGDILNELSALCVTPVLTEHGRRPFTLIVLRENGSLKYEGDSIFYSLSVEERVDVEADYESPLLLPEMTMNVRWSREDILRTAAIDFDPTQLMVSVSMYEVDLERGTLSEMATLARNIPNDGSEEITLPRMIPVAGEDQVSPVAIRVSATGIDDTIAAPDPRLLYLLARSAGRIGFWGPVVYYSTSAALRLLCEAWCLSQPDTIGDDILTRLPPCPPTISRARNDRGFVEDSGAGSFLNSIFHPGAGSCFRQATFTRENQGSGQQCCYDDNGNLLTGSQRGAGSVDRIAPAGTFLGTLGHFGTDVLPYIFCCWGEFSDCEAYHAKRPADNGNGYEITPPACVYGDPHIVTLDGLKYTFNGKGEFILIETEDNSFELQGRMVDAMDGNGSIARATVFSAIVARQADSDTVQFELSRRGLDALVNGERLEFDDLQVQAFNNVTVRVEERNDTLSATFSSGARIEVTAENGILSVLLVSLPDSFQGRTRGLMGNFNGDTLDDLQPRSSQIPIAADSLIGDIHFNFGVTWIVNASEDSLFTYSAGVDFMTFFDENYIPQFMITFSSPELQIQAEELCNGDPFCLYDVMVTGRMDIGLSTLIGSQEFEEIVKLSYPIVCNPPCENGACVSNDTCSCAAGYNGSTCNQPVLMDCDVNPCALGETCAILAGSYICASCNSTATSLICRQATGLTQTELYIIIGVCAGVGGLLLLGIFCFLVCCCCFACTSKKQDAIAAYEMQIDAEKVEKDNPTFQPE